MENISENTLNETIEQTNLKNEIAELLNTLVENNTIPISSIPNINLYVDQLTTFIEENLFSNNTNHLTKSMVNNYCKNKVVPPAIKKKYTKSHMLLLILIYNTKSIISITDIKKIFDSIEADVIETYYTETINLIANSNQDFIDNTLTDLENLISKNNLEGEKVQIAILATKLAIEANYKKLLSELLIEKYL